MSDSAIRQRASGKSFVLGNIKQAVVGRHAALMHACAMLATTIIRRHITLQIQHHDRASLLAGKLHAILQRPYSKGRDIYDLLWHLGDPTWPAPNLALLNNALRQTGWRRDVLGERLKRLDWEQVAAGARPFLAPGTDKDRAQDGIY